MRVSRALVLTIAFWADLCLAASPPVQDQSVADFKAPRSPVPASSSSAETPVAISDPPAARVPARIILATPNGSVARGNGDYVFKFAGAPMPEVIAAIASIFQAKVTYAGRATLGVAGEFTGATLEQALSRLAEGAKLRYRAQDAAWLVSEGGGSALPIPTANLSSILKPAEPSRVVEGSDAAAISAATAGR